MFAVMLYRFARPGLQRDRLGLLEALLRLLGRDVVALVVIDVVRRTASKAGDDTALGDVVEQRDLLSQANWMVQRRLRHRKSDLDTAGHRGQRRGKADRVDIGADAVEMMLGQPHRVEAKLLGQLGLRDGFIDDAFVKRRFPAFGKQEVAELHTWLLFSPRD